jgi:mannose-6-phosphate isomerase-like protein (cupin superfamily)
MASDGVVAASLAGTQVGAPDTAFVVAEWTDDGTTTSAEFPIAPLHVHHSDDEAWYVLEGTMGFRVGDRTVEASAGSAVFVPRGVPHTFSNARSEPARYLLIMSAGIARPIEELHSGVDDIPSLFAKHDSELLN